MFVLEWDEKRRSRPQTPMVSCPSTSNSFYNDSPYGEGKLKFI